MENTPANTADPSMGKGDDPVKQAALIARLAAELGPRVDTMLKQGGEDGLTDQTCRRWLVARKWDFDAAKRDLAAHAQWRREYVPNGKILDKEVAENLAEKKTFLQGVDAQGHPVVMVLVQRHIPKSFESIQRFICYTLDAMVELGSLHGGGDGKGIGILNLTGMTMSNYDITGLRAIFDTLQNHYPERLHSLYLYDAPVIFYGIWRIVSPFIDPVTRQKVQFVYPNPAGKKLLEALPVEVRPVELGGTAPMRDVDAVVQLMAEGKAGPLLLPSPIPCQ